MSWACLLAVSLPSHKQLWWSAAFITAPSQAYKTGIMAAHVWALMDHLGWQKAHVMGMSLGGKPPQMSHTQLWWSAAFITAPSQAYKTGIMAADVWALMDHLGWQRPTLWKCLLTVCPSKYVWLLGQ